MKTAGIEMEVERAVELIEKVLEGRAGAEECLDRSLVSAVNVVGNVVAGADYIDLEGAR